jgi:ribosomal protein S18 acetylase RimI-like enzyme
MEIRQMKAEDVTAVGQLYLDAYGVTDWNVEGAGRYVKKFFDFEPERCRVVAETDGTISGAILAYTFEREKGLTLFIQELVVAPSARKRGYGKKLVTALRESTSNRGKVRVKPLVKADTSVLNFYNSLGFERDKVVSFAIED